VAAHLELQKGERSELAELAANILQAAQGEWTELGSR
jgi:hypothetical protein